MILDSKKCDKANGLLKFENHQLNNQQKNVFVKITKFALKKKKKFHFNQEETKIFNYIVKYLRKNIAL